MIHLSIIIPSYKNAVILDNNLPYLITNLSKCDFTNEIIIVDDGSDDNGKTKDIASKYNCKFILSETNKGKGNAVRLGMISATGKYRIFTDADIPYEFENITNMLYYLDFKEFEMVVGDRTLENSKYFSEITVSRNLGSKIFSFIVGRFIAGGQLLILFSYQYQYATKQLGLPTLEQPIDETLPNQSLQTKKMSTVPKPPLAGGLQ